MASNSSHRIDPRSIRIHTTPPNNAFLDAALDWFRKGFSVIPIIPGTKRTALKWDPWLDGLSADKIRKHWEAHPDHELGFIVGDGVIVLDADTPMAVAALYQIEEAFDLSPSLIVSTTKGEHHYFQRPKDSVAKSDSHSSEKHPERIDVKTGRALIMLPPSPGKEVFDD